MIYNGLFKSQKYVLVVITLVMAMSSGCFKSFEATEAGGAANDANSYSTPSSPFEKGEWTQFRRLSKREFVNSMETVLGVNAVNPDLLPLDGVNSMTLDNDGSVQFLFRSDAEKFYDVISAAVDKAFLKKSNIKYLKCAPSATKTRSECTKEVVRLLQWTAFRVPHEDIITNKLIALANSQPTFDEGIKAASVAVLMSPKFLFNYVSQANGKTNLNQYELAKKIALFLWSDLPDNALAMDAYNGKLNDSVVLAKHIERMINHSNFDRFAFDFVNQWLKLYDLDIKEIEEYQFPNMSRSLIQDMKTETKLFIKSVIQNDGNMASILGSDYTYINARLAEIYKIPGSFTNTDFVRVDFQDKNRIGIMSQPSVLTLTSNGISTSPIVRGVWILHNILCQELVAPAVLPSIDIDPVIPKTMKERFAEHSKNPACYSCHKTIDPLGFGLENYDIVGRFRFDYGVKYDFEKIDSSGTFDGESFTKPTEYAQSILKSGQLHSCVSNYFTAYGLGRVPASTNDKKLLENVIASSKTKSFKDIIKDIIMSSNFKALVPAGK